jgi:hypothetical protein
MLFLALELHAKFQIYHELLTFLIYALADSVIYHHHNVKVNCYLYISL